MIRQQSYVLACAVAATLAASSVALAQNATQGEDAAPAEIEEIVVTAQKREENVQDVPLSVAAFSGDTLLAAGIDSVLDLERLVPNLNIKRLTATANVRLTIRGIGAAGNSSIDPSVGTFIDGVYVPRPGALFASFHDMAGVEVLRGPQGTLFGRNSTVGGLLLRTADPRDELEGAAGAEFGNDNQQNYTAMLNVPLGDAFAVRVSGLFDSTDGYVENLLDGRTYGERDTSAGRIGLRWDITDSLSWLVKADYAKIEGDGVVAQEVQPQTVTAAARARLNAITGGRPPDYRDPYDQVINQRTYGDLEDEQWGVVSNLTWDLANDYSLRLLSGFRSWENQQLDGDVVYTAADMLARTGGYDSESQSHELQLFSPVDELFGGRFDFVAGLYWFQEDFLITERFALGANYCGVAAAGGLFPPAQLAACNASPNKAVATDGSFTQDASSYAIYAQGNIGLTDTLTAVLGGRWTSDEKDADFVQLRNNPFAGPLRTPENTSLSTEDDQFTYRVGLNWTPTGDLLVFASYATGYKSGGINSGFGTGVLGDKRLFDAETSQNYEVGVKSTLAGGAARVNATLFRVDLDDFQDRSFDGTTFRVKNAGSLRHQGFEVDGEYLVTDGLRVFGALGYLDSEFTDYKDAACLPYPSQVNPRCTQDRTGERNAFSPEWTASVGAQLDGDLAFGNLGYRFRTDLSYTEEMSVQAINDGNPDAIQPSYTLLSARFSLLFGADRHWSLSVFGDNLTDEGYCGTITANPFDQQLGLRNPVTGSTLMRCVLAPPRSYGVGLRYEF